MLCIEPKLAIELSLLTNKTLVVQATQPARGWDLNLVKPCSLPTVLGSFCPHLLPGNTKLSQDHIYSGPNVLRTS
jgi:hypothetical protein